MISVQNLIWDGWNRAHIARHDVVPDEVEQVCFGQPHVSQTYSGRVRLIGKTNQGRMLTIILAPKGDEDYYPVTARSASRRERKLFIETKEGESIS